MSTESKKTMDMIQSLVKQTKRAEKAMEEREFERTYFLLESMQSIMYATKHELETVLMRKYTL